MNKETQEERPYYISFKESVVGPFQDPYEIHVHRYQKYTDNDFICTVCNKKKNTNISNNSITSIYDLDSKQLAIALKNGTKKKDPVKISYNYSIMQD
jgi:hypothetical protein